VQYKKEAFTLFETMMGEVREDFVQRLFRVQVQPAAARQVIEEAPRLPKQMVAQHAEAEAWGSGAPAAEPEPAQAGRPGGSPAAAQAPRPAAQPARALPRVGRNDPCPCGSGKKYKKCHMPADERVGTGT
jgi:preprotein translocase subunit SecA